MSDINSSTIIGRITHEPEIKYTQSGSSICAFSIASNRKYKDQEEVTFIEVVCFGKTADAVSTYCKKGSKICVDGYLKQNSWENSEGKKLSKHQIVANNIQFLDSKNDSQ